ncbi:MAG: EscE/YscE/SsaE family type III secretion system needle protein co-chaperone [Planctomycetota bacterium]
MTDDNLRLTEIESQLADDKGGRMRDSLCDELREEAAAWKRQLDRGLPPEEFVASQRIADGLIAATEVIEKYWHTAHR